MENNSTKKPSSQNNANPFPKLKPKGSIYIHQIPPKQEKNELSKSPKHSNITTDFLSKIKFFQSKSQGSEQNQNNQPNNKFPLKHSKTLQLDNLNLTKKDKTEASKENKDILKKNKSTEINNNKKEDKKENDKGEDNIDDVMNIDEEKAKFEKRLSSCTINDNSKDNDSKKPSSKKPMEYANKIFHSITGYINDNVINKININFKNDKNKENDSDSLYKDLEINFEKPANFEVIEEHWNYEKHLLDYDILDFTSKSKIFYLLFLFSHTQFFEIFKK